MQKMYKFQIGIKTMNKFNIKHIISFSFFYILIPLLGILSLTYIIPMEYSKIIIDTLFIMLLWYLITAQKSLSKEFKVFKTYTEKRFDDNKISRNAMKTKIKKLESFVKEGGK